MSANNRSSPYSDTRGPHGAEDTKSVQHDSEQDNANIYIAGLGECMNDDMLHSEFSKFGTIASSKSMMNRDKCKGIAFVKYTNPSEAEAAIAALAGAQPQWAQMPLTVKLAMPAVPPEQRNQQRSGRPREMQAAGGPGQGGGRLRINCNETPMLRMLTPLVAEQNGAFPASVNIKGMQVVPASGHNSVVTGEVSSLYVHGLPLTCNEQTLYELFSPFGAVLNVKPIYDLGKEDKPCKGFGFVNYHRQDDAYHAMVAMNGYEYHGRKLTVTFKTS